MPQIIQCPKCAKKLSAPDQLAGNQVACPVCKAPVAIPALTNATLAPRIPPQPAVAPCQAAANTSQSAGSRPAPKPPAKSQLAAKPAAAPVAALIQCPHCSKKFSGPVQLHGKSIPCPVCNKQFTVQLQSAAAASPAVGQLTKVAPTASATSQKIAAAARQSDPVPARRFAVTGRRPRMLYLVFALAFIPLTLQTLSDDSDLYERLTHTLAAHPGLEAKMEHMKSLDEMFTELPDHRIEGAFLSHDSHVHWIYALASAAIFFAICWLLFDPGKATIAQWVIVLAVTATVGIVSLLAFQWMAAITQGVWVTGHGIIVVLFYIVKFIGYSYSAASDPDSNFLLSFLGFTCGVGLCEEVTKALPVIVWLGEDKKLDWRAACILGLASGIGFGVVEGIIYAGSHYNGLTTVDIYFTRFISCVALHATWTAAVALMAVRNLGGFNTSEASDYAVHMLLIISAPAVLHGLYDTLLKKGFEGYALAVALASFAWLAFLIERARNSDDEYVPRRLAKTMA